jgi:Spy/CpxP family protein refolding chaperone
MNIQKQALILTLSLVGLTNMNYTGLKPALAEQNSTQTPQQHQNENHQTKPPVNPSTNKQHQNQPESEKEDHLHNGKENQLNLTTAQAAQIKQIEEASRQKINAVYTPDQQKLIHAAKQHEKVNLNLSADQKAKIKAIYQDTQRQIQGLLTAEQKQKLQEQHSSEGSKHQSQQTSTKPASEKP